MQSLRQAFRHLKLNCQLAWLDVKLAIGDEQGAVSSAERLLQQADGNLQASSRIIQKGWQIIPDLKAESAYQSLVNAMSTVSKGRPELLPVYMQCGIDALVHVSGERTSSLIDVLKASSNGKSQHEGALAHGIHHLVLTRDAGLKNGTLKSSLTKAWQVDGAREQVVTDAFSLIKRVDGISPEEVTEGLSYLWTAVLGVPALAQTFIRELQRALPELIQNGKKQQALRLAPFFLSAGQNKAPLAPAEAMQDIMGAYVDLSMAHGQCDPKLLSGLVDLAVRFPDARDVFLTRGPQLLAPLAMNNVGQVYNLTSSLLRVANGDEGAVSRIYAESLASIPLSDQPESNGTTSMMATLIGYMAKSSPALAESLRGTMVNAGPRLSAQMKNRGTKGRRQVLVTMLELASSLPPVKLSDTMLRAYLRESFDLLKGATSSKRDADISLTTPYLKLIGKEKIDLQREFTDLTLAVLPSLVRVRGAVAQSLAEQAARLNLYDMDSPSTEIVSREFALFAALGTDRRRTLVVFGQSPHEAWISNGLEGMPLTTFTDKVQAKGAAAETPLHEYQQRILSEVSCVVASPTEVRPF